MKTYSFAGFEPMIESLCGVKKGFFVDIGAHDGLEGKYFEDCGWEGVCIEPHPDLVPVLKANRKCRVEDCALWSEDTTVSFRALTGYTEMLSGIVESYDYRHSMRIERELDAMGGTSRIVQIPARRFDSIIKETKIDYLSIDTEGSELQILSNIDFNKYDITVICVENNFLDPAYEEFFKERGYKLHSTHLACDQIYVKIKN